MREERRTRATLGAWVVLIGAVTGAGGSGAADDPGSIVARYEGGTILRGDFEAWLSHRNPEESANERRSLEQYAVTSWLADEALARRAAADPIFSAAETQLAERLLVSAWERATRAAVVVTDEELDMLQAANPDAFQVPRRVRVRNLFKRFPETAGAQERAAVRKDVVALRTLALSGADFGELAREHSDSETGLRGGRLGVVKPGVLPGALERVVLALEEGEISAPVELAEGFSIFLCEAVLPAVERSPAEVRSHLESNLRRQRFEESWSAIEEQVVGDADLRLSPSDTPFAPGDALLSGTGVTIDTYDLAADLAAHPPPAGLDLEQRPAARRIRLEYLAGVRLLARAARSRGFELSESDRLTQRFRRLERLAIGELARRVNERLVKPSGDEIRRYYEEHRDRFVAKPEFELSAIRLDFDRDGGEQRAVASRAREIVERLRRESGAFAGLARELALPPASETGGYLGWVPRRRLYAMGGNILLAVEALEIGEVSGGVREGEAYWVFHLHGHRPSRPLTFEEASESAEEKLGQELANRARTEIEAEVLSRLKLRYEAG